MVNEETCVVLKNRNAARFFVFYLIVDISRTVVKVGKDFEFCHRFAKTAKKTLIFLNSLFEYVYPCFKAC